MVDGNYARTVQDMEFRQNFTIVYPRNYVHVSIQVYYFDIETILKVPKSIVQYRIFDHVAAYLYRRRDSRSCHSNKARLRMKIS